MILFERIRFKNIMSFGDMWTEMDLNRHSSTIIVGENGEKFYTDDHYENFKEIIE